MASDFEPYEPNRTAVPARTENGRLIGVARNVQIRSEGGGRDGAGETVLTFRLEKLGRDRPVEVELRSVRLSGSVSEGDEVSVLDRVGRSGRIEVSRLHNLTTSSVVGTSDAVRRARVVVLTIAIALVLVILAMIGVILFGMTPGESVVEIQ